MTYVGRGHGRRPRLPRTLLAGAVLALPVAVAPLPFTGQAVGVAQADVRTYRVRDVQGAGHVSPLNGRSVTKVPGVVTAVTATGFWMQDPSPDRDDATSEGVFVFTRTKPTVAVADSVQVDGRVSEFRPGGSSSGNLGRTEIDATAATVVGRGVPLPAPVTLGPEGRRAPGEVIDDDPRGGLGRDVESSGAFAPRQDALDFYESLEGMRVRVEDAVAAGPSHDGQVPVLPAGGAGAGTRTGRGGIVLRSGDANPERVVLDDALAPLPGMSVGDRLPGVNDGVLDYGLGTYTLLLTRTPRAQAGGLARETTRPQRPGELAVATLNADDLDPDAPDERFRAVAADIVNGLRSPDLITVSGVQDNSGPDDDGTVAADQTVAELIAAISEVGGPEYDWRSVSPRDNADGGDKGANARVGFLFRSDRGLGFVDRPADSPDVGLSDTGVQRGPDLTSTAVRAVREGGRVRLSLSPGRVAPADPAWSTSRKPLAGEVTWQGRRIIVVAGHWYGGTDDDQPWFGRKQPPLRPSEWRREAQARVTARFVRSVRSIDRNADVIVAGNLNENEFGAPVRELAGQTGLRNMTDELPQKERYTAVTSGNSQALDHIMLSPSLSRRKHEYDIVHRHAEFAGPEAGDRDPAVVRIDMTDKALQK